MTVLHAYPTWATGATGPDAYGHNELMKVPSDYDADSPYGWFLAWLFARYRRGADVNAGGPRQGAPIGNGEGAWITALEPVNEPNYNMFPQDDYIACHATNMMKTAEALSFYWRQVAPATNYPTWILGPATSDVDETTGHHTHYYDFSAACLDNLAGWKPNVYVGWSHHNYRDIELNSDPTRVAFLRGLLYQKNWKAGTQNKWIWLTEGGCRLNKVGGDKATQATRVQNAYGRMTNLSDVYLFSQHGMDPNGTTDNGFPSHLRDDWQYALNQPGATRPVFWAWYTMNAASSA